MKPVQKSRGFTLVELLVVIGIILVLIAIVVMGIRHTSYMAARHETEVEMKVLGDMLTEYQAINGMKNIEGPVNPGTPVVMKLPYPPYLNHEYSLPIYIDQLYDLTDAQPASAIGLIDLAGTPVNISNVNPPPTAMIGDMSDKGYGNNPRYNCRAMYNMFGVMYILLRDPKNRALIANLPPKRILETWASFSGRGANNNPPFTLDAAIPLDGWGNPIIFVPRGGLHVYMDPQHVTMTNPASGTIHEFVVRSSGTYDVANLPPISPNDRPFFASPGPDGYFTDTTGVRTVPAPTKDRAIDNLYSFQAQ